MSKLLDRQGRSYVRRGNWLLQYIADNVDAIDADMVEPPMSGEIPMSGVVEIPMSVEIPTEAIPPTEPVSAEDIEPRTCRNTPMDEAVERLTTIVNVCFRTGNGLVWLENDLVLWDSSDPERWLAQMRSEWGNRIHSGWLDEFMNALELWIVAH